MIIARVTFLLALAPALAARKGALGIPVYLGDALQLSISEFMAGRELNIRVPPPPAGEGNSGEKVAGWRMKAGCRRRVPNPVRDPSGPSCHWPLFPNSSETRAPAGVSRRRAGRRGYPSALSKADGIMPEDGHDAW